MLRSACILAAALTGFAVPATAQTVSAEAGGARIEALIGYDDDIVLGAAVGYDVRAGRVLLGLEAEITQSSEEECETGILTPSGRLCTRVGRDIAATARLGLIAAPNVLMYGKLGYTNLDVESRLENVAAGTPAIGIANFDLDGVRVGAGAQFGLSSNLHLKTEYRYSDYEDGSYKHDVVLGVGFRF